MYFILNSASVLIHMKVYTTALYNRITTLKLEILSAIKTHFPLLNVFHLKLHLVGFVFNIQV